jgi:hypothetical protein
MAALGICDAYVRLLGVAGLHLHTQWTRNPLALDADRTVFFHAIGCPRASPRTARGLQAQGQTLLSKGLDGCSCKALWQMCHLPG